MINVIVPEIVYAWSLFFDVFYPIKIFTETFICYGNEFGVFCLCVFVTPFFAIFVHIHVPEVQHKEAKIEHDNCFLDYFLGDFGLSFLAIVTEVTSY